MGFVIGAYRAVEHLGGAGSGHRSSPFWRAQDARTVEDVALTILPVEAQAEVREIVDAVEAIRHPHLLPVAEVVEDETRLALACPWPRGGRLIELVRRRGVLSVGEMVTVVLPLAAALAGLHRAEIRHGWVCPEAIWFDARGRPLLGAPAVGIAVATVVGQGALGSADVAPEVLRQARTGPAGPAADVFSLASVAMFCLTGRSAWPADEPADVLVQSAAGQWPDPPDDAAPPRLLTLLRSMLAPDAHQRPDAEGVVRQLSAAGSAAPEPIRLGTGPCPTPASSKRWRGWAGQTDEEPVEPAGDGADHPPPSIGVGDPSSDGRASDPDVGDDDPSPEVADDRPGPRGRRRGPLVRLAVALLSALLLTVLVAQVGNWLGDPPAPESAESGTGTGTDWSQVVAELDIARSRALASADPALLDEVYLPGSAAATADAAVIDDLADKGWRVLDGRHHVISVQVLEQSSGGATVAVVDTLAARAVVDGAGQQVAATVARGEQRRVLVLDATDAGYRISAIGPG
ncbi:MAG TPA: protein kinase [Nakamurella sp.]